MPLVCLHEAERAERRRYLLPRGCQTEYPALRCASSLFPPFSFPPSSGIKKKALAALRVITLCMREEEREAQKRRNANKKRVAVVCLGCIAVKEEKVSVTKRTFGRQEVFFLSKKKYRCKKALFVLVFKRHFLIWPCVPNKSS